MATSRIAYNNFLTSITQLSNIVVTGGAVAQSAATVEKVHYIRVAATSATLTVSGTYTSLVERTYRLEVTQATNGLFATARYRWTDNAEANPIVWNASNVTPLNGTPVTLNNGIQITFASGPTVPYFAVGDNVFFRVILKNGPAKAADGSRNTEWRSGAVPSSSSVEWQIDLGTSVAPTVFALLDENMQSDSVVTLKGKASGFTDPPTYSEVIGVGANGRRMELITPSAFRYWRVTVACTTAPTLGYLRWSEMFLGTIGTFSRTFSRGFRREHRRLGAADFEGILQAGPGPYRRRYDHWTLNYKYMDSTDQALLTALVAATSDETNRLERPFFWLPMDSNLTDFQLVHWVNDYIRENASNTADNAMVSVPIEFAEVVRSLD